MKDILYYLLAYSGTALCIVLVALGWAVKGFISDKSKLLGWIVFIVFCVLAGFCIIARNFLFAETIAEP